jgi:hypothetical protein
MSLGIVGADRSAATGGSGLAVTCNSGQTIYESVLELGQFKQKRFSSIFALVEFDPGQRMLDVG